MTFFRKKILPVLIWFGLANLFYYFMLPPINPRSGDFWFFLIFNIVILALLIFLFNRKKFNFKVSVPLDGYSVNISKIGKKTKRIIIIASSVIIIFIAILVVSSSTLFRAEAYMKQLTVTESDFNTDIAEIPFSKIPVVDKSIAQRLGTRKIGEVVDLVSQFNVSGYYSQINYNDVPTRVSPLEYADVFKWMFNQKEGIPYYVRIDMATQNTELVELENGMKYSPSECFNRNLLRYLRYKYPTKMFKETNFEIDENGNPYWIVSVYTYKIGLVGGTDISGIITVNAVTGEHKYMDVKDVPEWIDRVYSADIVLAQAHNWGRFKSGFLNSIVGQKGVISTTEGYSYLALENDVWLYTGLTSVSLDESNIGFILVNLRTKEARTYSINGAEEYSAMDSAEGKVQEKGYDATFPILINLANQPTYFMSLKDNAGLVKSYAFVSVLNYQVVGVGETLEKAQADYISLLGKEQIETDTPDVLETAGSVTFLSSAVKDGNTYYYIKLGSGEGLFIASIKVSSFLPTLAVGDKIEISYKGMDDGTKEIVEITG